VLVDRLRSAKDSRGIAAAVTMGAVAALGVDVDVLAAVETDLAGEAAAVDHFACDKMQIKKKGSQLPEPRLAEDPASWIRALTYCCTMAALFCSFQLSGVNELTCSKV